MPQPVNPTGHPLPLATATWADAEQAQRQVLLIPLGALEQHGPHLPMDVDARVAAAVAQAAADGHRHVGVAPTLPIGASGEHAAFPGGLSMGMDALIHVLLELGRDATRHWHAALFVNAHGGNHAAVTRAVDLLESEGRRCGAFHAVVAGGDAHAGRTETSFMLHLAPALVRLDVMAPGDRRPIRTLLPALRRDGVRAVSPNGVLGDPTGASAEEGARLLAELGTACAARIAALAEDGE